MVLISLLLFVCQIFPAHNTEPTVHKLWEFKSARYLKQGSFGMDNISVLDLSDKSVIHIEIQGEKKQQTGKYKIVDNFIVILDKNGKPITDSDFDIRIESLTDDELTLIIVAHFLSGENKVEGDLIEIKFMERQR